ncbi:MAG: methyltransferase FkbM family [Ilumatobacteraceae bacterium]|nr:methyltransferase FkbM family [Ilumatobacteraceae bacterium]
MTTPEQWAYALELPAVSDTQDRSVVARCDFTVKTGAIGVAVTGLDGSILFENEYLPADGRTVIEHVLPVGYRSIIFRNRAPHGARSSVVVESVHIGEAAAGDVPQPLVARRNVATEVRPETGGIECFETPAASWINRARLDHLAGLDLDVNGRSVLEVGAGVGFLSPFFLERDCRLVTTEARRENVDELQRRFPDVRSEVADVEDSLLTLGRFDIVFCYGLLYHLESPVRALRNMAEVCDDLLLIETVVCDSPLPIARLDDETLTVSQALRGLAHRPSSSYLALALNRIGFDHVYAAVERPDFPDFIWTPVGDDAFFRDGHLLRRVFVASRSALYSSGLVPLT